MKRNSLILSALFSLGICQSSTLFAQGKSEGLNDKKELDVAALSNSTLYVSLFPTVDTVITYYESQYFLGKKEFDKDAQNAKDKYNQDVADDNDKLREVYQKYNGKYEFIDPKLADDSETYKNPKYRFMLVREIHYQVFSPGDPGVGNGNPIVVGYVALLYDNKLNKIFYIEMNENIGAEVKILNSWLKH